MPPTSNTFLTQYTHLYVHQTLAVFSKNRKATVVRKEFLSLRSFSAGLSCYGQGMRGAHLGQEDIFYAPELNPA
jgi:hypothetical protein